MSNVKQNKVISYGLAAFVTGTLFGGGLTLSQMVNPQKVLGFLDILGDWDPALIFVMLGALLVTIPGFHWVQKKEQPFFALKFLTPSSKVIDKKLLTGAALFGIGWGLVGLCPGPALTALVTLNTDLMIFVVALIAGMYAQRLFIRA
ncbi:MAG: hypothetical protein CMP91_11495 [Gammaproteobacteria bacterium]|nr:hypothetical protein [Gammaproteobacteria bacterium]MAY03401.1 hypothetical protein [Gammaproteobacteria bacterium]